MLPPLRERKDDIPVLTRHFIEKVSHKMNRKVEGISEEALKKLMNYDWPGNIRELSNVIERAINLCDGWIESRHLILREEEFESSMDVGERENHQQKKLKDLVAETEKRAIRETLRKCGSIRQAARALGVSHATIINKMREYGITQGET
jgi:transcriptional regulator of aroF, aroG, tyrA and aromatic amino acid transport